MYGGCGLQHRGRQCADEPACAAPRKATRHEIRGRSFPAKEKRERKHEQKPSSLERENSSVPDMLATSLSVQGKYPEAEALQRQVLEAQERVLGPDHPHTLTTKSHLATSLSRQGKHPEAEARPTQ